jgi:hypothetical protein
MAVPGKVRGRPFQPGNPGRPPGSKNGTTQLLERLAEEQAEQLLRKIYAASVPRRRGVPENAARPPPKVRAMNVSISPIEGPEDALSAIAAIFSALGQGELTPDETTALSLVVRLPSLLSSLGAIRAIGPIKKGGAPEANRGISRCVSVFVQSRTPGRNPGR